MLLRFAIRAVGKLSGRLLKSSKGYSAPFRQKAQMRIAAERSLTANLTQKLAHGGMILEVPRG
jgi:hypothetical protein